MRTPHNERVGSDIPELPQAQTSGPERRCILSGDIEAKDCLVRLAISPDGPDGTAQVLPDILARAPGRGAWLGVSRPDLEAAMAKGKLRGALARAFKGTKLQVPDDLPDRIERGLSRVLLDRLGLELRAGKLILGSDRIAEQARSGRVELLLHASDASDDGSRKLDQAWRVGNEVEGSGLRGMRLPLDRAALSVALGRDNVVHLALADSASADRVTAILARLLHFQGAVEAGIEDGQQPAATDRDDELSFEG